MRTLFPEIAKYLFPVETNSLLVLSPIPSVDSRFAITNENLARIGDVTTLKYNFCVRTMKATPHLLKKMATACLRGDNVNVLLLLKTLFQYIPDTYIADMAAGGGATECCSYILERTPIRSRTTVAASCIPGRVDHFDRVHAFGGGMSSMCMQYAVRSNSLSLVKHLIGLRCPFNPSDVTIMACESGSVEVVQYLMKLGLPFSPVCHSIALIHNRPPVTKILFKYGCIPDSRSLYYVIKKGDVRCFKKMLSMGCVLGDKTAHVACMSGNIEIIRELLKLGVNFPADAIMSI